MFNNALISKIYLLTDKRKLFWVAFRGSTDVTVLNNILN